MVGNVRRLDFTEGFCRITSHCQNEVKATDVFLLFIFTFCLISTWFSLFNVNELVSTT